MLLSPAAPFTEGSLHRVPRRFDCRLSAATPIQLTVLRTGQLSIRVRVRVQLIHRAPRWSTIHPSTSGYHADSTVNFRLPRRFDSSCSAVVNYPSIIRRAPCWSIHRAPCWSIRRALRRLTASSPTAVPTPIAYPGSVLL